jgi:lipase chaperone LimK
MSATISAAIEPLIKRKIFGTEEEAIRELTREYVLHQIAGLQRKLGRLERKYSMGFQQFSEYLHERSILLQRDDLSAEQRQTLGRAIMQEKNDWLDWKAAQEMLESWLGLRKEIAALLLCPLCWEL